MSWQQFKHAWLIKFWASMLKSGVILKLSIWKDRH